MPVFRVKGVGGRKRPLFKMQRGPAARAWPATLGLLALATAQVAVYESLARLHDLRNQVPEAVALFLVAGTLFLVGVYWVEKFSPGPTGLAIILGTAVLLRLLVLPVRPALSEDVYRYQWEGRVQRARLNPYTVFPAMPGLAWLQDPHHPLEAGKTTPTLYPPLSELAYSWVETVPGYKRIFTALDLASLILLLLLLSVLKQPRARVLIYAWNPAVIASFAMCGHHDSLAIATLLAAHLFIIGHRPALSIVSLSLSFLSKYFSLLLLPVFLKRTRWPYLAIFGSLVLLGYLPFVGAGWNLFKGLSDYAVGWESNDSLFRLIRLAGNSKGQAELIAVTLTAGALVYALRTRMEPLRASLFLTATLLLLSPDAFPWYFSWSIPFLCFYPNAPWLLMSVTSVLGYSPVVAYAGGQAYRDSPFMLALEYAPVLAWLGVQAAREVSARKN